MKKKETAKTEAERLREGSVLLCRLARLKTDEAELVKLLPDECTRVEIVVVSANGSGGKLYLNNYEGNFKYYGVAIINGLAAERRAVEAELVALGIGWGLRHD